MNWITKRINDLNEWLDPLEELAKDEDFRGEVLASVGFKEKPSPEEKAKTKEKLNKILELLNYIRKKLGLDKSDIPKVNNIPAFVMLLAEVYTVLKALKEMLESCDYFGLENSQNDQANEDKETAIVNAMRAISRLLTQTVLKKKAPSIAARAEAAGIFADEYNETKRALDLVFYPLIVLTKSDFMRPVGDVKADDQVRITKGFFMILSAVALILEKMEERNKKFITPGGKFLFNFGYELPPEKDVFPLAGKVAGRMMQMQFIPGAYFNPTDDEWIGDELFGALFKDSFLSFATIPVFAPNAGPETKPLRFQYLLGLELNPGSPTAGGAEPGTTRNRFSLKFPTNFVGSIIWEPGINVDFFNSSPLSGGPLLIASLAAANPGEQNGENGLNTGDISFSIEPKKTH